MSNSLTRLISHIKNGQANNILVVQVPKSKINIAFLQVLQETGYIRGYRTAHEPYEMRGTMKCRTVSPNLYAPAFHRGRYSRQWDKDIQVLLKYREGKPAINNIIQISKPSRKIYFSIKELSKKSSTSSTGAKQKKSKLKFEHFLSTTNHKESNHVVNGTIIVSTSKGLLSHLEAYKMNIGGEVLCQVH